MGILIFFFFRYDYVYLISWIKLYSFVSFIDGSFMLLKLYRIIDSSLLIVVFVILEFIVLFGNWVKELG